MCPGWFTFRSFLRWRNHSDPMRGPPRMSCRLVKKPTAEGWRTVTPSSCHLKESLAVRGQECALRRFQRCQPPTRACLTQTGAGGGWHLLWWVRVLFTNSPGHLRVFYRQAAVSALNAPSSAQSQCPGACHRPPGSHRIQGPLGLTALYKKLMILAEAEFGLANAHSAVGLNRQRSCWCTSALRRPDQACGGFV